MTVAVNPHERTAGYPRALLVNVEPIGRRSATGITMGNLLRGWPKDRIAQIYCEDYEPDATVCERSWRLDLEDLRMPEWLRRKVILLRNRRRDIASRGTSPAGTSDSRAVRVPPRVYETVRTVFFQALAFSSYRITQDLCSRVREFSPEVIYSVLGNLHLLKLVQGLSRQLGVPVVPHFMDDWVVSLPGRGWPDWCLKRQLLNRTREVIDASPVCLVISAAMAREYQGRYGRECLPFMNCVDPRAGGVESRHRESTDVFRFAYAGALHLGRWTVLRDVGEALASLASSGIKAVVDVYAPPLPGQTVATFSGQEGIRYRGLVEPDQVQRIISGYDGVLHVESFEDRVRSYTRFSVSTKIPEYLSSGTPIFAYGPKDLASMEYLEVNDCGVVVGTRSRSLLVERLSGFISDSAMRSRLVAQARAVCVANHDAGRMREEFREALARAANIGSERD